MCVYSINKEHNTHVKVSVGSPEELQFWLKNSYHLDSRCVSEMCISNKRRNNVIFVVIVYSNDPSPAKGPGACKKPGNSFDPVNAPQKTKISTISEKRIS